MSKTPQLNYYFSKTCLLGFFAIFISSCSSGPKTQFYGLFASAADEITYTSTTGLHNTTSNHSIGIGPVILPDYLDNPAIVSRTDSQQLRISGYNAWAGDLKNQITRVVSDNISTYLKNDAVWGFPWDTRSRPHYQIRIVIEEFSGVLGKDVTLKVKWSLLATHAKSKPNELLKVQRHQLTITTEDASYNGYVKALNTAINDWSILLGSELNKL